MQRSPGPAPELFGAGLQCAPSRPGLHWARRLSAGAGKGERDGDDEEGGEEKGKPEAAKGTGRGNLLTLVSGLRGALGVALGCTYVLAMLSLDFYWAAVKPQNFVFFISMGVLSWAINKFRFNSNKAFIDMPAPPLLPQAWIRPYAAGMGIISIALPWLLLLSGQNFYKRLFVMAPHLYLIMAQVLLESVGSHLRWAVPVRLMTPVAFNAYRLLSLRDWFETVMTVQSMTYETMFYPIDKLLVTANIVMWTFNLVVVLFAGAVPAALHPKYLPERTPGKPKP